MHAFVCPGIHKSGSAYSKSLQVILRHKNFKSVPRGRKEMFILPQGMFNLRKNIRIDFCECAIYSFFMININFCKKIVYVRRLGACP